MAHWRPAVSSLLLNAATCGARVVFRTREFATRQALGASAWDVSRLIFIEVGLLAIAGVVLGLTLTAWTLATCDVLLPREFAALGEPSLTSRVIGFACLAGGAVMTAGLLPAWVAWRATPVALFTQMARADTKSVRALRFSLATIQSAVAVIPRCDAARTLIRQPLGQDPVHIEQLCCFRLYPSNVARPASGDTTTRCSVSASAGRARRCCIDWFDD